MFFIFFLLNIIIVNTIISMKYTKQFIIENGSVTPLYGDVPPNRYTEKSQFRVGENFNHSISNPSAITFNTSLPNTNINVNVLAKDVDVNIVLIMNDIVPIIINFGSVVTVNNNKYLNICIASIVFVVRLYVIYGILNVSYPKKIPPIISCIKRVKTTANNIVNNTVIYLLISILVLVYGFTKRSFIVPLENSSLTIDPLINIIIIIIIVKYSV